MYIGIGAEKGKEIFDEDAFLYALERSTVGADKEEFDKNFPEFHEDLVEWFYSGNWRYKEE